MVNQLATELMTHQRVKGAGQTIHAYREHGESLAKEELALALSQLESGEKAEDIMRALTHRLTQKLLHPTSILLREAAKAEDPAYLEMMQHGLEDIAENRRKVKR